MRIYRQMKNNSEVNIKANVREIGRFIAIKMILYAVDFIWAFGPTI